MEQTQTQTPRWAQEPASVDDAVRERRETIAEIKDIDAQLGTRNRRDGEGERIEGIPYWQWRDRAIAARRFKERRQLFLKDWLARHGPTGVTSPKANRPAMRVTPTESARDLKVVIGLMESVLIRLDRFLQGDESSWSAALAELDRLREVCPAMFVTIEAERENLRPEAVA